MRKHLAASGVATAGLAVAVIAALTGAAPGASAAGHPARAAVPDSAPTWLAHGHHVGGVAKAAKQSLTVYLAPKGGEAALEAAVTAMSTPGSATYGHFLTAAQYYAAYAPSAAEQKAVTSFLTSSGLHVTGADAHGRFLTATGTAAAAEAAFGTTLGTYTHDGQTVQAPAGTLSLPTAVAPDVLAVDGLDTTQGHATVQTTPTAPPPAAFRNAQPCSTYYGQVAAKYTADYQTKLPKFQGATLPYAVCGYTGPQFRSAYEGNTGLYGDGVTVGIVDAYASPTIASDANTYATQNGDGSYGKKQLTQTVLSPFNSQAECGPSGWYGEETLDVEAVHAMAPDADIHYYGGASCNDKDLLKAIRTAVDQDKVEIITNSYGEPEEGATAADIHASEQVFLQGAAEGISFTFSSGDNGDELQNTGIKQTDYQTSDPYVTSVGGTSTGIDANAQISLDTGWGTDKYSLSANGKSWTPVGYLYGSGGGYSALFPRPSYQDGVISNDAPAGRGVPDVAMDADPTTGMLVGQTQTDPDGTVAYGQYRIGGTSLASPLFAGMTALKIEAANTGKGLGLLNPTIYGQDLSTFTDIKGKPADAGNVRVDYANSFDPSGGLVYSVRTFDQDSSLTVTKGWDDVTGVGVPSPAWITSGAS